MRVQKYKKRLDAYIQNLCTFAVLINMCSNMFDANKTKEQLIVWIREWFERNGPGCNAIVGVSGGKDSTIVAALCKEALGADRVIGISMPDKNQGVNDADEICNFLGIRYMRISIEEVTAAMSRICDGTGVNAFELSHQAQQNIPPRVRMMVEYAVGQTYNGRVSCNCNLSEDWIGYSTRWGDASGDFSAFANLTVTEVRQIGHALGLPSKWVEKTPDDGLPHSSPDEVKFGFTYETLDKYIRGIETPPEDIRLKIDNMHAKNLFKLKMPEGFMPEL